MVALDSKIVVTQERRPCMVFPDSTNEVKGLVHCIYEGNASIELESGRIVFVDVSYIRFLDSESLFKEYKWGDEE